MCVVSMIGDDWRNRNFDWSDYFIKPDNSPTREEFEALKKELESLKKLLKAAKIYDEETGQPNCEMDAKVDLIKKLAEIVGVDLEDIF